MSELLSAKFSDDKPASEPEYDSELPAPEQDTASFEQRMTIDKATTQELLDYLSSLDPDTKIGDILDPQKLKGNKIIREILHRGFQAMRESNKMIYGEPEKVNLSKAEEEIGVTLPKEAGPNPYAAEFDRN